MAVYKLKLMPAIELRGIIEVSKSIPAVISDGPDDYVCGKCGSIIAKSVKLSELKMYLNAAFKCYECKQIGIL